MISGNTQNKYLDYTDIIHAAFEFYKNKVVNEMRYEKQNNNNFTLVDFFQRLHKKLNKTKDYYIQNIRNILEPMESADPSKYDNIGIFRSVLFVYERDLDRCINLLNTTYNLYPVGKGSMQEKSTLVKEILKKIQVKS
ncbi:MAG: hypothetical protein M3162_01060 [Thermoproteota archaeon]|nr:hypothetical protein [Thermoproteota archaeon]